MKTMRSLARIMNNPEYTLVGVYLSNPNLAPDIHYLPEAKLVKTSGVLGAYELTISLAPMDNQLESIKQFRHYLLKLGLGWSTDNKRIRSEGFDPLKADSDKDYIFKQTLFYNNYYRFTLNILEDTEVAIQEANIKTDTDGSKLKVYQVRQLAGDYYQFTYLTFKEKTSDVNTVFTDLLTGTLNATNTIKLLSLFMRYNLTSYPIVGLHSEGLYSGLIADLYPISTSINSYFQDGLYHFVTDTGDFILAEKAIKSSQVDKIGEYKYQIKIKANDNYLILNLGL